MHGFKYPSHIPQTMYHDSIQVDENRNRSLMLVLIMVFGAVSTGIPNATALTGNETVGVSNLTNNSTFISLSNLDSSDSYYWWAYIFNPNGSL